MNREQMKTGTESAHIVFFTGGTAVGPVSRALVSYTRHTAHIITTFDSGGSTAALRRAFGMVAVGDLRNRLLALADPALVPAPVLDACRLRLPAGGDAARLRETLRGFALTDAPLWRPMPSRFAAPLHQWLAAFVSAMPPGFDPHVAILGNLILAGGYIQSRRNLSPVIHTLSALLHVRGRVVPVAYESMHLAAELADGSILVGQHKFCRLGQPVRRLFLTPYTPDCTLPAPEVCPALADEAAALIASAGAICYPMGSFYTSVVANLLPAGVVRAITSVSCPKFYIANTGLDAEQCGHSVAERVHVILETLRRQQPSAPASSLLHAVLVDTKNGDYPCGIDPGAIAAQGVSLIDLPLVDPRDTQRHDPALTARAIIRAASGELWGGWGAPEGGGKK